MEIPGGGRRRRRRMETKSFDGDEEQFSCSKLKKKVQVIYYLSRNGQLQHPHFMEVSLLPNQTSLVLRDVINKLRVLRGKAVASLYSWSFKRTYKNGYVWNDIEEDDVIYPTDGVEYILKGSEIADVESMYSGELQKIELLAVRTRRDDQCKLLPSPHGRDGEVMGEKTPPTQCSRGVSTEELDVSPPNLSFSSSSSSEKSGATIKIVNNKADADPINNSSTLKCSFSTVRSPSLLLQLIACGSSAHSSSFFCSNINSREVKNARSLYKGSEYSMDENIPRFSGIIVESVTPHNLAPAECNGGNHGLISEEDDNKIESKIVKGKCIPGWRK